MTTVVLDTNVFVISLTSKSPYHSIIAALKNQQFNLVVSTEILLEYMEVLELKYSVKAAEEFLNFIVELPNVQFIHVHYNWKLIKEDEDDDKFVDVAVAGNADYLISEDKHFNILQQIEFPKVNVLNVDEFMN